MSNTTKTVGPFKIEVGPDFNALGDGMSLMTLGLKIETLSVVALALDALDCAGVNVSDEQYQEALMATAFAKANPIRTQLVEQAQGEVLIRELQRLREAGMDIPLQDWEQET
jgi:sensor domain CHASE-containing protein